MDENDHILVETRCPFRKSCASALLLGAPGSSPAPEATLARGPPRENPKTGHEFMKQTSRLISTQSLNAFSLGFVNHAQVVEGLPLTMAVAELTTDGQAIS